MLDIITEANLNSGFYDHKQLVKTLLNRWLKSCLKTRNKIYRLPYDFFFSRLFYLYFFQR
jgi:hypothetical protein